MEFRTRRFSRKNIAPGSHNWLTWHENAVYYYEDDRKLAGREIIFELMARWQSGYAADCKSAYGGSIPPRASTGLSLQAQ